MGLEYLYYGIKQMKLLYPLYFRMNVELYIEENGLQCHKVGN